MKKLRFMNRFNLIAAVIVGTASVATGLAVWAQGPGSGGREFGVTVENNYSEPLTINRVFDRSDRHAVAVMMPGERLELDLPFDSDQVFLVWSRGQIVDKPIVFNPQRFSRIGISIDQNRRITTQLAAR